MFSPEPTTFEFVDAQVGLSITSDLERELAMTAATNGDSISVVEAARAAVRSAPSVSDRMSAGKTLRQQVPRRSHAGWSPPAIRPDPIDLLQAQDRTRVPELVPIRYGRMLASPFAFLRGSATVMANDLAATPATGLIVQACGDAHLSNFGTFATPERNQVFDLNDFDETLPAPWEWDLKRLAASIVVAGRTNGFREADCADSVRAAISSYRERMADFAPQGYLAVWYSRISAADISASLPTPVKKDFERGVRRATHRDHIQSLAKLTTVIDDSIRIVDDPPLIVHHSDELVGERVPIFAETYRSSIRDDLRELVSRYKFVDFAQKVVGVGSVGTRCYVVLLQGNSPDDPLFVQIKEAYPSVLEPYAAKSQYRNHGQRIVRGQQYIQAASDIFLGWGRVKEIDLYARQLRDMKASVDVTLLSPSRLALYAGVCGWVLARAHARSGDSANIAGYLGTSETFDEAIVAFATAYADQTERDHAALVEAVKRGRVSAEPGK
jgi:uncharacterized protein (DUF2252 family)